MSDHFRPSHENIKRAERKFDQLKGAINGLPETNLFTIRIEQEADRAHVIARQTEPVPEDIPFEVVELVGRLRAALDKAVVCAVDSRNIGTSGVGFPFGGIDRNTGEPLPFPDPRTQDRLKKKLTPAEWDFILSQRPYCGGNDTLWAINEIANEDKHRKDLVSVRPHLEQGVKISAAIPGQTAFIDYLGVNKADADRVRRNDESEQLLLVIGGGNRNLNVDQELSVSVVFGDGLPVSGKNVLTVLNQQIRITKIILKGWARIDHS